MTSANRTLVVFLLLVAGVAVYWFLLLSPKRDQIADLDAQISQIQSSIATSEQQISAGEQAKASFSRDYAQLVTMGKAVPDGDEQAALLVQLNRVGMRNDIFFSSITMEGTGSSSTGAAPAQQSPATVQPSATAPPGEEPDPTTGNQPVAATESTVASLPIGATVGSAGLGVIPYSLLYRGNFFKLADFIGSLNRLVTTNEDGRINVNGRLMTINGFSLSPTSDESDLTKLSGAFSISTFVTPAAQGLTAGATPAGPGTGGENEPVLTGNTATNSGGTP